MKLLEPIDVEERKPLLFSYEGDLAADETVTLVQLQIELLEGTDPAYATALDGQPLLLSATREVMQWVRPHVGGVVYGLRCLVEGSKGGRHLSHARLPVRRRAL